MPGFVVTMSGMLGKVLSTRLLYLHSPSTDASLGNISPKFVSFSEVVGGKWEGRIIGGYFWRKKS